MMRCVLLCAGSAAARPEDAPRSAAFHEVRALLLPCSSALPLQVLPALTSSHMLPLAHSMMAQHQHQHQHDCMQAAAGLLGCCS